MGAIEDSSALWTLFCNPGWEIKPNPVKHLLKIKAPDYQEALMLYTKRAKISSDVGGIPRLYLCFDWNWW